ncbi:MAG: hypothetical protein COB59_02395 [Rhodospirillaceae bacterium]|nr:MAG: hypothetical protein COB59_02395 [Rhodospirillaceae bacterium]
MSLDITPQTPANRQLVNAYGDGGFKITQVDYQGSVVVFLDNTQAWSGELSIDGLKAVVEAENTPEILVVGCGKDFTLPPEDLRIALKKHGIVLEWMDTSAACRTFNILSIEERSVAAALVAVD